MMIEDSNAELISIDFGISIAHRLTSPEDVETSAISFGEICSMNDLPFCLNSMFTEQPSLGK
jgi:hypothetical protein